MKEVPYNPRGNKEESWYREAEKFYTSKIPENVVIASLSSKPEEAKKQLKEMRGNLYEAGSYLNKGDLKNGILYLQGVLASIKTGDPDRKFVDIKEILNELKDKVNLSKSQYAGLIKSTPSEKKDKLYREEREIKELGYEAQKQLDLYRQASVRLVDRRNRSGGLEERTVGRTSLPVNAVARAAAIISASGFILGAFFLSPNVTGNVIAQLTTKSSSFIGAGLVLVGIAAGLFWAKKR